MEEKIEALNNLKKQFLEKLNKKLKFIQLILQNYEKKIEDFDINYFIINNLENQIKFNLNELNLNKNDSLDKKIENITIYLNKNIKSQFFLVNKEEKKENEQFINNFDNDAIEVEYEFIKNLSYKEYFHGFLDFNKYLLAFYSYSNIIFIPKNDYYEKFNIDGIFDIKSCKKINDNKILVFTGKNIITIEIRDNSDYIILNNIENDNLSNAIFDFNSKLDFLCFHYEDENIDKDIGNDEYNENFINYFSFPDYDKEKFSIIHDIKGNIKEARLQFINDNSFFCLSSNRLDYFSIKKTNVI